MSKRSLTLVGMAVVGLALGGCRDRTQQAQQPANMEQRGAATQQEPTGAQPANGDPTMQAQPDRELGQGAQVDNGAYQPGAYQPGAQPGAQPSAREQSQQAQQPGQQQAFVGQAERRIESLELGLGEASEEVRSEARQELLQVRSQVERLRTASGQEAQRLQTEIQQSLSSIQQRVEGGEQEGQAN